VARFLFLDGPQALMRDRRVVRVPPARGGERSKKLAGSCGNDSRGQAFFQQARRQPWKCDEVRRTTPHFEQREFVVGDRRMVYRRPLHAGRVGLPDVVLVHGLGLFGRYMLPLAANRIATPALNTAAFCRRRGAVRLGPRFRDSQRPDAAGSEVVPPDRGVAAADATCRSPRRAASGLLDIKGTFGG